MDAHYEVTYFMDAGYDVKRVTTTVRDEADIVSCCVLHVPLSCPGWAYGKASRRPMSVVESYDKKASIR